MKYYRNTFGVQTIKFNSLMFIYNEVESNCNKYGFGHFSKGFGDFLKFLALFENLTLAIFFYLQKSLAVWSPAGDGEMGEKSPNTAQSPAASAASTAAESAASNTTMPPSVTGTQAGLAHWMSVMAEHMNSTESNSSSVQSYAWQNGMEVIFN